MDESRQKEVKKTAKATEKAEKKTAKAAEKEARRAAAAPPAPQPASAGPERPRPESGVSPAERSAAAAEQQVRLHRNRMWISVAGVVVGLLTLLIALLNIL